MLTRTVVVGTVLCALLAVTGVVAKQPAPATVPFFTNWWANVTEELVQANGQIQTANVISSWQLDSTNNRTAVFGTNIMDMVADFDQMTIFYIDWQRVCQYTCAINDVDDPCNAQINGNTLCSYDQENRSVYVGEEEVGGVDTYHYTWQDPLVNISMAEHELWVDTDNLLPVKEIASFHPFGTFEANWTGVFNTFNAGTPPASNFAFSNLQYCYPGSDAECADVRAKFASYSKKFRAAHKHGKIVLTEQ